MLIIEATWALSADLVQSVKAQATEESDHFVAFPRCNTP